MKKLMFAATMLASTFAMADLCDEAAGGSTGCAVYNVKFTFKKNNCSLLDGISKGQRVKVRFAIDGRRWEGPKGVQYFVDLTGLKIEVMNADGSSNEPIPVPPEPDLPAGPEELDDMPF